MNTRMDSDIWETWKRDATHEKNTNLSFCDVPNNYVHIQ